MAKSLPAGEAGGRHTPPLSPGWDGDAEHPSLHLPPGHKVAHLPTRCHIHKLRSSLQANTEPRRTLHLQRAHPGLCEQARVHRGRMGVRPAAGPALRPFRWDLALNLYRSPCPVPCMWLTWEICGTHVSSQHEPGCAQAHRGRGERPPVLSRTELSDHGDRRRLWPARRALTSPAALEQTLKNWVPDTTLTLSLCHLVSNYASANSPKAYLNCSILA